MAIYISDAGLASVPQSNFLNISTQGGLYHVRCSLFSSDDTIKKICRNPLKTIALHRDDKRFASVARLQIALMCIDSNPAINFSLPPGFKNDSDFGPLTEQAVKDFQALNAINQTGNADALTIEKLDSALMNDFYDIETGKYLRETINKYAVSDQISPDGKYEYKLTYMAADGTMKTVNYQTDIQETFEILSDSDSRYLRVVPENRQSNIIKDLRGNTTFPTIFLDREFGYRQIDAPKSTRRIPGSILYTIQPSDTIVSIIKNYYYGGDLTIKDDGNTIYTIKGREARQNSRMKFYILMSYFFNVDGYTENGIHFGGINLSNPTNAEALYNELGKIYMHENIKPGTTSTVSKLPNFYNFQKKVQETIPGYNLSFTGSPANFNTPQITVTPGTSIWLPPRHFGEMLYNYNTFNPNIMLDGNNQLRSTPNVSINDIKNEIQSRQSAEPDILSMLFDPFDIFGSIDLDTVAESVMDVYDDTIEFFQESYDYIMQSLKDMWPRGTGGFVEFGLGVTWGIPVATNVETKFFLWRKVTERDKITICISQYGRFFVGLDTGVGVGGSFGIGSKKKKEGMNLGVYAGASADLQAGLFVEGSADFEFPVTEDNCALLSMLMGALLSGAGGTVLQVGAFTVTELLKYFDVADLSPFQYLVKSNVGIGGEVAGQAEAEIGIRTTRQPNADDQAGDTVPEADKKKSWFTMNNMLKYADIGASAEANVTLKLIDIEYTAEYNPATCFQHGTMTRIPQNTSVQLGSSISAKLSLDLQKGPFAMLVGAGVVLAPLDALLSLLSFDVGFGFYVKLECDYTANPLSGPGAKLPVTTRLLKLGTFSGDTYYGQQGSEMYIYLNLDLFLDMITSDADFNIANVINLIHSFQYHKKVGIEPSLPIKNTNKTVANDPNPMPKKIGPVYGAKVYRDIDSTDDFINHVDLGFGAFLDVDLTVKIGSSQFGDAIVEGMRIIVDLVAIWDAYLRSAPTAEHLNKLREDLYNKFYVEFTKQISGPNAPMDAASAANYMLSCLNNVWTWFQNYTGTGINIYNKFNYNNTDPVNNTDSYRKRYTADSLKYVAKIPVDGLTYKDSNRAYWGMIVVIDYIFRFIKQSVDAKVAVEAYTGLSISGGARAAEGLKVAVKIEAGGGFFDRSQIIDKNQLTFLSAQETDAEFKKFVDNILEEIGFNATANPIDQDYKRLMEYLFT